jgi:hypothetical protein
MLLALVAAASGAEVPSADDLLASSIGRHDPGDNWSSGRYRMVLRESRPDGTNRDTSIVVDNGRGSFELNSQRDGAHLTGSLGPDGCTWLLNGSTDFSEADREHYRLTCERLERIRNYYVYLWGLPMKLRDPGTRLGKVVEKSFGEASALELRVTYDDEVGGDIWYFYFDPSSHDLIGYRFYHDEAANDGEYIVLEEVLDEGGLRLPRARTWYTHQEDKLLGIDTLMSIERLEEGK